jgi:hypothetical protein
MDGLAGMPSGYTDQADLAGALTDAGFTDVHVEPLSAKYSLPAAEDYLWQFQPFFVRLPPFRSLPPARRVEVETRLIKRLRLIEAGQEPPIPFEANVAYGRVPQP